MREILTIDGFADDAFDVRNAVICGGFRTEHGPDGAMYTGISTYPVDHWYRIIEQKLSYKIVPKLSCFRLNLAGELPHSWVHSDDICAKFASVLYLNTPKQSFGGTAFWKHKNLGINRMPSDEDLRHHGADVVAFHRSMTEDWKHQELWKMERYVVMQFNRFITYPTSLFHSRFPFEGFGKGPADGRLIWVCFYDVITGASR